jgi:uncharacterized membrane protein HdeD (DUF308 family)
MASTHDSTSGVLNLWWLAALVGAATFGVGLFLVTSPHETLKVLAVITGLVLLVDGAFAIIGAIAGAAENRGFLAIVGVLSIIAGLVLVKKPFNTLIVLTLIVGVWFVVAGAVRFVSAFSTRERRAVTILAALVELVAGVLILSWPELGLATFAVIVGIVMMLRGLLLMYAGWLTRKLAHGKNYEQLSASNAFL